MSSEEFFQASIVDEDILSIVLRGNLDSASTPEFEGLINQHLEQGRSKIMIDCQYLGYVSSIGLGSLVALQTRLKRKGGAVKLCAIQGPVMQILRLVRLDSVLDIYGDREFARKSFYE